MAGPEEHHLTLTLTLTLILILIGARWLALESITELNWCGSALVGGILADRYGYASTFLITAAMQLAGSAIYWVLLPVIPVESTMQAAPAGGSPRGTSLVP